MNFTECVTHTYVCICTYVSAYTYKYVLLSGLSHKGTYLQPLVNADMAVTGHDEGREISLATRHLAIHNFAIILYYLGCMHVLVFCT